MRAFMNTRAAFVGIGLAVNLLVLVRGVILMTALDYGDLGLVALVQGGILFAGMLHFGLLNGGYRLLCHLRGHARQRVVDLAYTGFLAIGAAILLAAIVIALAVERPDHRMVALLGAAGGIATLLRTWMMNEMVAGGRLASANWINALAIAASLGLLALLPFAPAPVAVASIVLQPVLFAMLAPLSRAVLRPRALRFSKRLARVVFRAGFPLFLTGIAMQFNTFAERSYVTAELGLDALGRLYLAFLFLGLFQMVPNLVQQVYLPEIVRAWNARESGRIARESRMLLGWLAAYCTLAGLALWLLAEPLLALVLPRYVPDLRWVYLLAPGLAAFALSTPFALIFNVTIRYRWFMIAYGSGSAATVLVLGGALVGGSALTLDGVTILRSAVYAGMALLLVIGWASLSRRFPEFRWTGLRRDTADPV